MSQILTPQVSKLMPAQTRKLEWLGSLIGAAVICAVLYVLLGPIGILYGLGFLGFFILANFFSSLFKSNPDLNNDPIYKKKLQDLVERQKELESKSE